MEARFGSYRITETISTGAIATVFSGVQDGLGRVVAIKALKADIAATSPFGEHLEREARLLRDVFHPNVVLLLEGGRAPSGRPYLVFEWVDGPSLAQFLAVKPAGGRAKPSAKRALPVPVALAIGLSICAGLEHLHERGIVHRDLTPSNVLLSRSGVAKIIDFGLAQGSRLSKDDPLNGEGITASGRIAGDPIKLTLGTPDYVSPEQILGDYVDGRSDLFSLGVILYELLTATRPFEPLDERDAKRSAAQRIRRDAPLPLRDRAPSCPRAVERVVMRLLEKSPADRYESAGAVKERLEALLRAETRESPSKILRDAIAGEVTTQGAAQKSSAESHPMGLRHALAGLAAIGGAFGLSVFAIEGPSAHAREARVTLRSGSEVLELLPESAGGLAVLASPWAHVRVDGQLVETTPFSRPIPLKAGRHFVTLEHPDAPSVEREVTIASGEKLTLEVTMNLDVADAGKDAP